MLKKSHLIRTAAALALAATLAACGGGDSNYTIGGTIYGLQPGTELILTTNGMEVTVTGKPLENGVVVPVAYSFPKQLEYGEVYNVVPKTLSTASDGTVTYQRPAHQNCGPSSNSRISDTAGRLSVISADYTCALVTPTIGGVVKGLQAKASVVLGNGSDIITVTAPDAQTTPPADLPYTFNFPVTYGQTYGVTVQTQPAGYNCTLENPAGQISADTAVTNITVNCVKQG